MGERPPAVLRRKRAKVLKLHTPKHGTGTLKLYGLVLRGRLLAICSPTSSQSPSRVQSIQASSLPPAGALMVSVTVCPWLRIGMVTPSSSAPSPVAAALGCPSVSVSRVAPSIGPIAWCRAPSAASVTG